MNNYRFLPVHKFSVAHMSSFLMLVCQKKRKYSQSLHSFFNIFYFYFLLSFFTPPYLLFFYFISSSPFSYI